jgi:oxalate---CoA ligase
VTETVSSLIFSHRSSAPALIVPGHRIVTYDELAEAVAATAGMLSGAGVGARDRVAIVEPDGPEFLVLLFSVMAVGAAVAPLNPAYTADEFAFYLGDIRPRLLLASDSGPAAARAVAHSLGVTVAAASANGQRAHVEAASAESVALLLHTSGTTSRPKQVPLLHRNLVASARTIAATYRLSRDDVSYCAMPLFHVHGLVASVLAPLSSGGCVVVPRRFTVGAFLQDLATTGVTWYSAGPTTHRMILDRDARGNVHAATPALRFVRSCSSTLPARLMTAIEARFGVPVVEGYGMTEASHQIASNLLPPGARVAGSVGVATGVEIAITDRNGAHVSSGAEGEVVIRGASVTPGYLASPEANAESFSNGWFRTGDQGDRDPRGRKHLPA